MKIHADYGDYHLWRVWDCEACKFLSGVKWVDDKENKYCVVVGFSHNKTNYQTINAKILIIPEVKTIYINPKQTKQELINDFTEIVMERAKQ